MSANTSRNLVAQLREADQHYAQLSPPAGAEQRLLARLEAKASSRKPLGLAWQNVWRPLVIVGVGLVVLALSVHDETQRAQSGPSRRLHPQVPAGSTNIETPPPKTPPRQKPMFLDNIVPTAQPTNDRPPEVTPRYPLYQNESAPSDDFSDEPQPPQERFRRVPLSVPWIHYDGQPKTRPFMMSPTEWYWPGSAAKSDNPLPFVGGGSSPSSSPSKPSEPATRVEVPKHHAAAPCYAPDSLKKSADLDCSEKGLLLSELTLLEPCANGLFRRETHECIETELEACFTDTLGDGKTCQDPGNLKMLAYDKCVGAGQQLTDLVYDMSDCAGMVKMAKYTCCAPSIEPPPNPPSCQKLPPVESAVCKDLGTLKLEASDLCAADGGYLFDMQLAGDCPGGQASTMYVACCYP